MMSEVILNVKVHGLDRKPNLVNNKHMKRFSKHIALFLALVIMSNGVFGAQMTVSMIKGSTQIGSTEDQLPCHGEVKKVSQETAMECCQGDCMGCVLSPSVTSTSIVPLPMEPQNSEPTYLSSHLLPAYVSNLYRPPILI